MKAPTTRILIVDDDEKILFAFRELLKAEKMEPVTATDGEAGLKRVESDSPDVVFMDITMPNLTGLDALERIKKMNPRIPVVMITGFGTMQTAIKAIQLGAFDYLTKPLDIQKVREVLKKAISSIQTKFSVDEEALRLQSDSMDRYEIIGRSAQMHEVYKLIGSISTTSNHTSVLVLGESGTGKELVARAIHANCTMADEPFIPINVAGFPESLLESELFGHEKGAFTGAGERKIGKFEAARGGTIFLDEIANISLPLQQKLLRVLQEREFERLGGNDPIRVNARFIAATNVDLVKEVERKAFREDLFFRLNVVKVQLPPLRERAEDIPVLAKYFLRRCNQRLRKSIKGFSNEALTTLQNYSYPGNVRELENIIERATMLTNGDVVLPDALSDLPRDISTSAQALPMTSSDFASARTYVLNLFEKQFVLKLLKEHRGNVTLAAEHSGMTRQNFQRLMKKHDISGEPFRR